MIPINELRIGNAICDMNGHIFLKIIDADVLKYASDNCEPIPLTPEILEKCGFKNGRENEMWIGLPNHQHLVYDLEQMIVIIEGVSLTFVPYIQPLQLHQLQNLYFALTGEELQVNL